MTPPDELMLGPEKLHGWADHPVITPLTRNEIHAMASSWAAACKDAQWKHAFDEGEVCGLMNDTEDTENPYEEASNQYCGWSFGFWSGRGIADRKHMKVLEMGLVLLANVDFLTWRDEVRPHLPDDIVLRIENTSQAQASSALRSEEER